MNGLKLTYRSVHQREGGRTLVEYETNEYERPTAEAEAAFVRVKAYMGGIDPADLALIKAWHGNPVLYSMTGRQRDTSVEEAEWLRKTAEKHASERFNGRMVVDSWNWAQGVGRGVSVLLEAL